MNQLFLSPFDLFYDKYSIDFIQPHINSLKHYLSNKVAYIGMIFYILKTLVKPYFYHNNVTPVVNFIGVVKPCFKPGLFSFKATTATSCKPKATTRSFTSSRSDPSDLKFVSSASTKFFIIHSSRYALLGIWCHCWISPSYLQNFTFSKIFLVNTQMQCLIAQMVERVTADPRICNSNPAKVIHWELEIIQSCD